MKVVLSLGGSVFVGDAERIKSYAEAIRQASQHCQLFVVVGGGKLAREMIEKARKLGASETLCDYIGIEVTRLNAMLLAAAVEEAPKRIPRDFREADEMAKQHRVVIMGGTFPGHTTDATAALLAEYVRADLLLNATAVDGIYSADPKVNRDAVRFDRLSPAQLIEIVSSSAMKAGSNVVLDLLAAKVIERSRIRTMVFLGTPENILRAVKGEIIGTVIEVIE